jgi:hypothetical protein
VHKCAHKSETPDNRHYRITHLSFSSVCKRASSKCINIEPGIAQIYKDWAAMWKTRGSKPRRGKRFCSTSNFELGFWVHPTSWVIFGLGNKKSTSYTELGTFCTHIFKLSCFLCKFSEEIGTLEKLSRSKLFSWVDDFHTPTLRA